MERLHYGVEHQVRIPRRTRSRVAGMAWGMPGPPIQSRHSILSGGGREFDLGVM